MKKWHIWINSLYDIVLEREDNAHNKEEALDVVAQRAGYDNWADSCEQQQEDGPDIIPDDIGIFEVEEGSEEDIELTQRFE